MKDANKTRPSCGKACHATRRHAARRHAHDRRATVLVFVLAILGVLFVTGITFLTSVNFQAQIVENQVRGEDNESAVDAASGLVVSVIERNLLDVLSRGSVADGYSTYRVAQDLGQEDRIVLDGNAWTELPGLGLVSSVEPENQSYVYPMTTDFEILRSGLFSGNAWTRLPVPSQPVDNVVDFDGEYNAAPWLRNDDPWDGLGVDASGDGIPDARQYRLFRGDIPVDKLERLAATVNDETNPVGRVYMAARVVAHGAMANVNDSHPNLLQAAFEYEDGQWPAIDYTNITEEAYRAAPYLPALEEPLLRRRGSMFPPALMPISALHGNPALTAGGPLPGGGDFSNKLFPQRSDFFTGAESALDGRHQYWPFTRTAEYDGWLSGFIVRMDPRSGDQYDRRHLVTSISHDDLMGRGANVHLPMQMGPGMPAARNAEIVDLMIEAVQAAQCNASPADLGFAGLQFEYIDYPQTVVSDVRDLALYGDAPPALPEDDSNWQQLFGANQQVTWCECAAVSACEPDVRKGLLQLSLPWLDSATVDPTVASNWTGGVVNVGDQIRTLNRPLIESQRNRLIYEAFFMLLLNARSAVGQAGEFGTFDMQGQWTRTADQWSNLSRTAAALTANMIDFADADDLPTRIAVREMNFDLLNDADQINDATVGAELDPVSYVYGLERQPFMTEIAAYAIGDENMIDTTLSGFAVELFNPYQDPFPGGTTGDRFLLRFPRNSLGEESDVDVPITQAIPAQGFLTVYYDNGSLFDNVGSAEQDESSAVELFSFRAGDTIELLREVVYRDPVTGAPSISTIVIDEFVVPQGDHNGTPLFEADAGPPVSDQERRGVSPTIARSISGQSGPWMAAYPATEDSAVNLTNPDEHSLGLPSILLAPEDLTPVELVTADIQPIPGEPRSMFAKAFPTTGSLLLLLRYANDTDEGPFTRRLGEGINAGDGSPLDHGHMPVFDDPRMPGAVPADHLSPGQKTDGMAWESYRPGELKHLPWGQLIFDYFTALPLTNPGPYRVATDDGLVRDDAMARVDLDGLRVHGRININAAPWTVLRGLPIVPMGKFLYNGNTTDVYNWLQLALEPVNRRGTPAGPLESGVLGEPLAKGMVAYRDMLPFPGEDSGNYATQRGWAVGNPAYRRGTGFLSVGELANVRDALADRRYRIDDGMSLGGAWTYESGGVIPSPYVHAVAYLVGLGDWVTTRSHVFTVYGTLRGEGDSWRDDVVEDFLPIVDQRALRFQQTIDRLPLLTGSGRSHRIGDPVVAKYSDVLND